MNTRSLLLSGSILAAFATLALTATGQPIFNFSITDTNTPGMSVTGTIDFTGSPTVSFNVENDSSFASRVTEFYILKPMKTGGGLVDGTNPFSTSPSLSDWSLTNELDNDTFQYVKDFDIEKDDYVGAILHPPGSSDGIHMGETVGFSFDLDLGVGETVDWAAYPPQDLPHVVVRWQSIVGATQTSAKGYGSFTPVPEPSQIAALSIVGLGALLMIRRRIKAKRAAKD